MFRFSGPLQTDNPTSQVLVNSGPIEKASYVPSLLVRHLAMQPGFPDLSVPHTFESAILVADITGFSTLANQFAERGLEGAEALSVLVNDFFDKLITVITGYGGEIQWFAGDATVAVWIAAPDMPLPACVRLADQCAHQIQEQLQARPIMQEIRVQARIGVDAGLVTAFVARHSSSASFLLNGKPIEEASAAAASVEPGQVGIGESARTILATFSGQNSSVTAFDGNAATLPRCPGLDELLSPFLPSAVLKRLDGQHPKWIAEFRLVTIMFINLFHIETSTIDTLAFSEAIATVRDALEQTGGTLLQIVVDEHGPVLLTAWGLPGSTHEDDASRAVGSAMRLSQELIGRGIRCHIGIATGMVFCGDRGNDQRREYAVIGGTVNLAARLMHSGMKDILCDAVTMRHAAKHFHLDSHTPIYVKGHVEPIPIFHPRAPRSGIRADAEGIVGRTQEVERLNSRLLRLISAGEGGGIAFSGDAGIGKSMLLSHFIENARSKGIRCVTSVAEAMEQSTAYYIWRNLLAELVASEVSDRTLQEAITRGLENAPHLWEWIPLLGRILPLGIPDNSVTSAMSAAARADATRELAVELVLNASRNRPMIIALDDGHWVDSASWNLVLAIVQRVRNVCLIVASRPERTGELTDFARFCNLPGTEVIRLSPLGGDELTELLCRSLEIPEVELPLRTLITECSGGNPYFLQQYALSLQETGRLTVRNGAAGLIEKDVRIAPAVPSTIQNIVAGRIDRLPLKLQFTLKVASVVGRNVPRRILEQVHPELLQELELEDQLAGLVSSGLLDPVDTMEEPTYVFSHAICHEVAYELLTFSQREQLHTSIAEWYQRNYGESPDAELAVLAHHWSRANRPPTAIQYLEKAAAQALSNFANAEAIGLLSTAIDIVQRKHLHERAERLARWEWWLGRACLQLADNSRSRKHLESSLKLLDRPLHARNRMAMSTLAGLLRQSFNRLGLGSPGRVGTDRRESLIQAADIYHELSEIAYFANDFSLLLYSTVHTLNTAERARVPGQMARAYATAGVAAGAAGFRRAAMFYCARSLQRAEETDDLSARAFSQLACGVYYSGAGEWTTLDSILRDCAKTFERMGDRYRWELTLAQHAYMFLHRAQFAQAEELLTTAYGLGNQDGALQVLILSVAGLLSINRSVGADPEPHRNQLQKLLLRTNQRSDLVLGHGLLAEYWLQLGDRKRAADSAIQAVTNIRGILPPSFYVLRGASAAAETLVELSMENPEHHTSQFARHACRALNRFGYIFEIGRPASWLCRTRLRARQGNAHKALHAANRSLKIAEELRMPYDAARAHWWIGRLGRQSENHFTIATQLAQEYRFKLKETDA